MCNVYPVYLGGVSPAQMPYNLHCCYDNYKSCQNQAVPKPDYGGNTIVHLVFGVKGFQRSYSPLRVLPKGTELVSTQAIAYIYV